MNISYEDWVEKYRPIQNPINTNSSYDGTMFETFGEELDYVRAAWDKSPNTVWTLLESDGYETISAGYHHVNRMGYFITEQFFANEDLEVVVSEPDDDEDESRCLTEGCTDDPNDGEGFDGYCGNCADRREAAEEGIES